MTILLILPVDASAQNRQGYYQPRVYNSPPPRYSRDANVAAGRLIGGGAGFVAGAAAAPYIGPAARGAPLIGSTAGGYYAGRAYDNQVRNTTQQYYYAPAYGIQTTTPYMTRTVPRY